MTTNIDKRNTKRGKCLACKECEEYEYVLGEIRSNCAFCGHTAPDHVSLGVVGSKATTDSSSVEENSVLVSPTTTPSSSTSAIEDIPVIQLNAGMSVNDFLNSVSSASKNKEEVNTDDIPMPENLPSDLDKIFNKKLQGQNIDGNGEDLDKKINKLNRVIVDSLHEKGFKPSKELLQKASKKAVQEYPLLSVKGDSTNSGLCNKMKRRFEKVKETSSKSKSRKIAMNLSVEQTLLRMQDDWEQELRTPSLMKAYMETLRESRLEDALSQSADEHLRKYPALRLKDVLLRELEAIVGKPYDEMRKDWINTLPKLVNEMRADGIDIPVDADNYVTTAKVLEEIHRVKVWYKKNKESERKTRILEVFDENTSIAETWAKNKDPPRLMAVKNPDSDKMSMYCFVDTTSLFVSDDPIEAACLLLATFYAFEIGWTPKAKLQIFLLVSIFLSPYHITSKVSNNAKFITYMRKLGLDV